MAGSGGGKRKQIGEAEGARAKRRKTGPSLLDVARRTGCTEPALRAALKRRGAVSEYILQQISEQWQPMVEGKRALSFTGRSVTSVVPVALRRGRVSDSVKVALRAAFEEVTAWGPRKERPEGRDYQDVFFRVRSTVRASRTNGGSWQRLAPKAVSDFAAKFLRVNTTFVDRVRKFATSHPTHSHHGQPVSIFENPKNIPDNLFAYASLYRCSSGASDMWHCDGGPSTVFMAVSVQGGRILQVEDAIGNLRSIVLREGEVYMSSPSCFWHCVKPLDRRPAKTLILRSSILTRRYSGGRGGYKQTDQGTSGYAMATKEAFEGAAKAIFEIMRDAPISFTFDLD